MNRPDISVIVPIYNTEMFIGRCIDSILSQNFTNFELILVDDGSRDNSGEICDHYADTDTRITVVHQSNSGVSVARNTGIKTANGRYVCFVDSDDILLPDALYNLWNCVLKHPDVDVVCGQIRLKADILAPSLDVLDYSDNRKYIRSKTLWKLLNFSACARIVSRELIEQHQIYFIPGISYGEDPLWTYYLHKYIKSVAQCRIPVYQYCLDNEESAMHRPCYTKKYLSTLKCAELACLNFEPDGRKAEMPYILNLLSVTRYNEALKGNDFDTLKDRINKLCDLVLNSKVSNCSSHRMFPIRIRYAAWRIKRLSQGKRIKSYDFANFIISELS